MGLTELMGEYKLAYGRVHEDMGFTIKHNRDGKWEVPVTGTAIAKDYVLPTALAMAIERLKLMKDETD